MIIIETCPKCGHDLVDSIIATYPPIPEKSCPACGWHWVGEQEEVVRIPFGGNTYSGDVYSLNDIPPACQSCSNHPTNGGSGICHCVLGAREFTY